MAGRFFGKDGNPVLRVVAVSLMLVAVALGLTMCSQLQPGGEEADNLDDAPGCFVTNRLDRPDSGVCYMPNALL